MGIRGGAAAVQCLVSPHPAPSEGMPYLTLLAGAPFWASVALAGLGLATRSFQPSCRGLGAAARVFCRWGLRAMGRNIPPSFRHSLPPSWSIWEVLLQLDTVFPGGKLRRLVRPANKDLWNSGVAVLHHSAVQNLLRNGACRCCCWKLLVDLLRGWKGLTQLRDVEDWVDC